MPHLSRLAVPQQDPYVSQADSREQFSVGGESDRPNLHQCAWLVLLAWLPVILMLGQGSKALSRPHVPQTYGSVIPCCRQHAAVGREGDTVAHIKTGKE